MRGRPRRRQISKAYGSACCLLMLAAWALSFFVTYYSTWLKADSTWFVGIGRGYVECYYPAGALLGRSGMMFRGRFGPLQWRPRFIRTATSNQGQMVNGTMVYPTRICWYVGIPMWLPLFALAIPTAILWYRDRPPRRGCCTHCGYDLTGNVSGVCPECGKKTRRREEKGTSLFWSPPQPPSVWSDSSCVPYPAFRLD